ncbi:MAG TPA: FHA domain-containing protein [Nitriliruptoraceae bacterium]|nr:FHA domain-containing protein [Nitriliruptoraceae bacterium]
MYCSHCGETLDDGDNFCAACGAPVRRHDQTEVISLDDDHGDEVAEVVDQDDVVTTIAIDLDGDGDLELLEDLPALEPGTGLFVIARGPLAGARYVLDRDVTTIGRHPDADLLLDDVTVSRHHAEVRHHGGIMLLVDMGSLNGTYVGSHRVEEHQLAMGDHVQIGRFKLIYVAAGDEGHR